MNAWIRRASLAVLISTAVGGSVSALRGSPDDGIRGAAFSELSEVAGVGASIESVSFSFGAVDQQNVHLARVCRSSYILEGLTPDGRAAVLETSRNPGADWLATLRSKYPRLRTGVDYNVIPTMHCPSGVCPPRTPTCFED
ncbi:MAG: hypothetical protein HY059_09905 [Proteobacteria bacterium]|nr:hypothetical protein [Pseudomonadota bacterium]